MLESMISNYHHTNSCSRALALIALNKGTPPLMISKSLSVSEKTIYDWASRWRKYGILGALGGNVGGAPRKLTDEMIDFAVGVALAEPLTLAKIAAKVLERFPDAVQFSNDRLSVGLKSRGLTLKRLRVGTKTISYWQSASSPSKID